MEKINIKFHENGTVTFQHNKILQFVPELSVDKNSRVIVPNIPLLVRPLSAPHCARKNKILNFLNFAHFGEGFKFPKNIWNSSSNVRNSSKKVQQLSALEFMII
jgi:hypothetical protein